MECPYCKGTELVEKEHDYHQKTKIPQPINTFLSVLYECPECGTTVETSQRVIIVTPKEE